MTRRLIGLLVTLALGLLVAPLAAEAQQAGKVPRIGILVPGIEAPSFIIPYRLEPFRRGLREGGYVEGQTIIVEYRFAGGKLEHLAELAAELVKLQVDVIVTAATPAAKAAKTATSTIPIVMVDPGDPVGAGLVQSLARPGGNATALSSVTPDLAAKRLQLLKEIAPGAVRVAVVWNSAIPPAEVALSELQDAARMLHIHIEPVEVQGAEGLAASLAALKDRAMPFLVFPDPLTFNNRELIVEFAAKNRVPAVFGAKEFVDAGGLASYGPSYPDMFQRAGTQVGRILKGAKPADLPVEQPMKFELVVNLKTAQALGLTIPPTLLFQADEVIR
jgi:putative tryptophan/tyrosine transport system substrate-binding protein